MRTHTPLWSVDELEALSQFPVVLRRGRLIEIDLSYCPELTAIDFARLIVLRKRLLARELDLRVTGLCGHSRYVYRLCRLTQMIPETGNATPGIFVDVCS